MFSYFWQLPTEILGHHVLTFLDVKHAVLVDSAAFNRTCRVKVHEALNVATVATHKLVSNNVCGFMAWQRCRNLCLRISNLEVDLDSVVLVSADSEDLLVRQVFDLLSKGTIVHLRKLKGPFANLAKLAEFPAICGKIRTAHVGYGDTTHSSKLVAKHCFNLTALIVPAGNIVSKHIRTFCSVFSRWEYLKSVSVCGDESYSGRAPATAAIAQLFEQLQKAVNLIDLHVSMDDGAVLDQNLLLFFQTEPRLQCVRIHYPHYYGPRVETGAAVEALTANCKHVKELHVTGAIVSNDAMRNLQANCPPLEILTISSVRTYGQTLLQDVIKRAHSLHTLTVPCDVFFGYDNIDLTAAAVVSPEPVASRCLPLPALRQLTVTQDYPVEGDLLASNMCDAAHYITDLTLYLSAAASAAVLTQLATKCPFLTSLTVYEAHLLTEEAFEAILIAHPHLRHLCLRCAPLANAALTSLGRHCPELQRLEIGTMSYDAITNSGLVDLFAGCRQLRHVELRGNMCCGDEALFAAAQHCTQIERLVLESGNVSTVPCSDAAIVKLVVKCPRLRVCSLGCPSPSVETLQELELLRIRQARSVDLRFL
jgi:hypothetical protein